MPVLSDVYNDLEKARALTVKLFDEYAYESGASFEAARALADEASDLLAQVAEDFAALENALTSTRPTE